MDIIHFWLFEPEIDLMKSLKVSSQNQILKTKCSKLVRIFMTFCSVDFVAWVWMLIMLVRMFDVCIVGDLTYYWLYVTLLL